MAYRFFFILTAPTKALAELLNSNVIGTPGKSMLYQHLEVEKKLDKIANPIYVNLVKGDNILGTCCFCNRETSNSGKRMSSFYLRYFTFKQKYRSSHKKTVHRASAGSELRNEINRLLSGEGLAKRVDDRFFHYAYVDPENSRSLALCNEFGFKPVRKFSTVIFNRLHPKNNVAVEQLADSAIADMQERLTSFYKNYTMFSFENLFNRGDYFIIRDEKKNIIAGVQANPDRWKIIELPGISGKFILNLFSALPYLNRVIKKEYDFITLEGLYLMPGNEKSLAVLLESILAVYGRNSAMLWLDNDSALYKAVKSIDLGLVAQIKREVTAHVICKFVNVSKEDQSFFAANPAYISGTDLT